MNDSHLPKGRWLLFSLIFSLSEPSAPVYTSWARSFHPSPATLFHPPCSMCPWRWVSCSRRCYGKSISASNRESASVDEFGCLFIFLHKIRCLIIPFKTSSIMLQFL